MTCPPRTATASAAAARSSVPEPPYMQPEMSHNVQKYDKNVYLRVSEAQRCRVHSTLMVPVFGSNSRDKAMAVFELVQVRIAAAVPCPMSHARRAGQGRQAPHTRRSAQNQPAARPSCTPQATGACSVGSPPVVHASLRMAAGLQGHVGVSALGCTLHVRDVVLCCVVLCCRVTAMSLSQPCCHRLRSACR